MSKKARWAEEDEVIFVNSARVVGEEGDNQMECGLGKDTSVEEGIRHIDLDTDKAAEALLQTPQEGSSHRGESVESAAAERKLDQERHQAMLDAIRCRIANRKRRSHLETYNGRERHEGTIDEQAQKRTSLH